MNDDATGPDVLADDTGHVVGLAIDHVGSLDAVLAGGDPGDFKRAVALHLGHLATTVLVDEANVGAFGDVQRLPGRRLPARMIGLPDTGGSEVVQRLLDLAPDVVKAHVVCTGPPGTEEDRRVERWGFACHEAGVPFLLEPLVPGMGDRTWAIVAMAKHFGRPRFGVDILKLQLPFDETVDASPEERRRAHHEINLACGDVPFVFLSGGSMGHDTFVRTIREAGEAGTRACGVIAGRAIWGDAAAKPVELRTAALEHAASRMEEIADAVRSHLPPMRVPNPTPVSEA